MDDNTIQYQERTTTYSDWEVLEKMLELVDETAIDYADFKVAKDYVSLHEELQKCYSVKRQYENDHYLWLHAFGAELKSKEIEKEISSFSDTNSHSLSSLLHIFLLFFINSLDIIVKNSCVGPLPNPVSPSNRKPTSIDALAECLSANEPILYIS